MHIVATRAAVPAAPAVFPVAHQVAFRVAALWILTEDVPAFVQKRARSGAVVVIATVCRVVVSMVLVHEERVPIPGAGTFDGRGNTGCKRDFPVFPLVQGFSFLCAMERTNAMFTARRLPTRSDAIQIYVR